MKNKKIIIPLILLVLSLGTYFRVISDGSIRTVEFLSILTIGVLGGVLLTQIFSKQA
jgi:membrane protein CcdC involved in cytochrome C biogenesis